LARLVCAPSICINVNLLKNPAVSSPHLLLV